MSVPPSGTVTFLFTDVEGSTQLARQYPDTMPRALARHHALLHDAITAHHGYVFLIVGDEFEVAFPTATDALAAALAAQRTLRREFQPPTSNLHIHVRMGMHTGQAIPRGNDYEGHLTLSHTKRLMATAAGGQILLSQATEALVREHLFPGVTLRDLGEHRLKDFDRPEHIFQVEASDLPSDFPPLKTLGAFPNNLPIQLTSFVGRERELAELKDLLTSHRLVTLAGPGGTGKTRLSLQLAAAVSEDYAHGVWLVELAPLADPALVAQTIAATLGVREQPGRSIQEALVDFVRAKNPLLILDNCEHLIGTCAQMAETLLRAAPGLKIVASSREPLGIAGETVYRVPSLPLPDGPAAGLASLSQNECVRLLLDRATAVQPRFALTDRNASAVAQICRRLDGIPLAIELAAARVALFTPEQIAARLDDRFKLLTGGSRTALERHQTLAALIDWSHDLLSEGERQLFRQLSVFAGGWSFEAIQVICSDLDVLSLLTQLVNKSLVMVDEQAEGTRYRLPETVRQYARDKLLQAGEAEKARDRHLDFFVRFTEQAEPRLRSAEQMGWLERVEIEQDNLRAAMAWSLESGKRDRTLELTGALYYFWELRGYWSEGQRWLDEALALVAREPGGGVGVGGASIPDRAGQARRAKALYAAARLHYLAAEYTGARPLCEESLRLWRALDDKWWMAVTLELLGVLSRFGGDLQSGRVRFEEGVALARQVEDRWPLALCLVRLSGVFAVTDLAAAHRISDEAVAVARSIGDKYLLGFALFNLAGVMFSEGEPVEAESVAEEALREASATGGNLTVLFALLILVAIACVQGAREKARGYSIQIMALARETGISMVGLFGLFAFGAVASISGQPARTVRLFSATQVWAQRQGIKLNLLSGLVIALFNRFLETARAQLDPAAFEAAWAAGQEMTIEQAIQFAEDESHSI